MKLEYVDREGAPVQPGDLVMSTAGEIKHPAVGYQCISPSYIMVGVVESYTYIKWCAPKGNSEWRGYINNHERVVVQWMTVDAVLTGQRYIDSNHPCPPKLFSHSELVDFYVDIPPTHNSKLKVLCKRSSCKLAGLNEFMTELIADSFLYHCESGWQHTRRVE